MTTTHVRTKRERTAGTKSRERFAVSTAGLRELHAGRPPWTLVNELIQNSWDEAPEATFCVVQVDPGASPGTTEITVTDDGPGFRDPSDAWTYKGTVGEGAAIEFTAFLRFWRELPHPQTVIDDPQNAPLPENASALLALCGSLYRLADDTNFESIGTYARRIRPEVGEFLIGSCVRRDPELQYTRTYINWAATAAV